MVPRTLENLENLGITWDFNHDLENLENLGITWDFVLFPAKIIFRHGKGVKSTQSEHFRWSNFKIFFNHGEVILDGKGVKSSQSGAFQMVKFQNFLQPW